MEHITIIRDSWGVGHASGQDRASAYFAQGYLAASDRIWQMEWDRRRASGTWAEVAGPSAVREDAFFRRIGLSSAARADWEALDESSRAMTDAYSSGVNRWLSDNIGSLPPEFEFHPDPPAEWEPWHCVAVYKVRHVFMGTLYRKLWRGAVLHAAGPDVTMSMRGDPGAATAMVRASGPAIDLLEGAANALRHSASDLASLPDTDGGSNSWAVHGSRTKSGLPILAGDPHRGIEFPNVYHQCHIACDDFDVIGLAFPGVPGFPHFGHNADVAWCITHGMADDTDVYIERSASVYDRRVESIGVFEADPVEVDIAATDSGPVILGDLNAEFVLAARWTGLWGRDSTFECLEPMLLASSCDEAEEAVRSWVIPVNNMLTADTAGNISFQLRGRVLERPVENRWTPVAGEAATRWDDLDSVPHDDLHHWRNPERGFLVTANNRTSDSGPYISMDFAGPSRHDRIVQLLSELDRATVDDMSEIHRDVTSLMAPRIAALMARLEPTTDLARTALDLVMAWDFRVTVDSAAAVVYSTFRKLWSEEVGRRIGLLDVEVGESGWPRSVDSARMLADAATTMLLDGNHELIPGLETERDLNRVLSSILDRGVADLAIELGPDPVTWRWDAVHVMVSPHPLASARAEARHLHPPVQGCPGDGDTVRVGGLSPSAGLRSVSGSVARYVFDTSDWDGSGWVVPHGVSGVRGSGHDLDQRALWMEGQLLPMAYSAALVSEHAVETIVLEI